MNVGDSHNDNKKTRQYNNGVKKITFSKNNLERVLVTVYVWSKIFSRVKFTPCLKWI